MASKKRKRAAFVIRGYEPSDAEAVAAIAREPSVLEGTLQVPFRTEAEVRRRFEDPSPENRMLVAVLGDEVVGLGGLHLNPRPRMRYVASIGMFASERARGRGIGAALLDALIDLGERWYGVLRIELCVFVDNKPAIALYRSRGFDIEGVARAYALRDGEAVDAFHMARVAKEFPWKRLTAEDAAKRVPPRLTAGYDSKKN